MSTPGLSSSELATQIAALERALYSGQRSISYSDDQGQSVSKTYATTAELERALEHARTRYAELTGQGAGGIAIGIAGWGRQ